ncbi:MAG: hypothetical protein IPK19_04870 [Chloroflexi bacterium]|nr:hypothetical protein [Chloroflexota bacterium]
MDQFLYSAYTVILIVLTALTARIWLRTRSVGTLMMLLVNAALIYENGVLALGVVIGHGPLLESLSWLRFIGYAAFPPLLVISGLDMARRSGVTWAGDRRVRIGGWVVAAALIVLGLAVEVFGRALEPRVMNGVVRYMWMTKGIPPMAVILMTLMLIGIGLALWRQTRFAGLFVGSLLLLVGNGLAAGKYVLGSGIEMAFMTVLLYCEVWVLHPQPRSRSRWNSASRRGRPPAIEATGAEATPARLDSDFPRATR